MIKSYFKDQNIKILENNNKQNLKFKCHQSHVKIKKKLPIIFLHFHFF